jgi:hypothetical protein
MPYELDRDVYFEVKFGAYGKLSKNLDEQMAERG